MSLRAELVEVEARADALRRQIAAETSCVVRGHSWVSLGGKNAGCGDGCGCSVPVFECRDCGDCDYGDNPEADKARRECAEGTRHD